MDRGKGRMSADEVYALSKKQPCSQPQNTLIFGGMSTTRTSQPLLVTPSQQTPLQTPSFTARSSQTPNNTGKEKSLFGLSPTRRVLAQRRRRENERRASHKSTLGLPSSKIVDTSLGLPSMEIGNASLDSTVQDRAVSLSIMLMGDKSIRSRVKEEKSEYPSVPPGFGPGTSFILKKLHDNEGMASELVSGSQTLLTCGKGDVGDDAKVAKSLERRPWINYSEFDGITNHKQVPENLIPSSLPKGVLRGCSECSNCQKVVAKWHPDDASRPVLGEAPIFYPTEEEFKDALNYIATIRPRAEKYGICRIVPPPSWNPPPPFKEKGILETSKFVTRIQQIDKLQNQDSLSKIFRIHEPKQKKRKYHETGLQCAFVDGATTVPNEFQRNRDAKQVGFEYGPSFTLETFQKYADDFKSHYFRKDNDMTIEGENSTLQKKLEPSVEDIEGEYWRIVEKPTEEIEVLYGADLDTATFGSGFPKEFSPMENSDFEQAYLKSDWNLNNISILPNSLLSFEKGDISGVQVPWMYIGMCFSSSCWHVEDHYFYSLDYMHSGAPKIWYGVPGIDADKVEGAMKKHLPGLFEEQPDLLNKLVTHISPTILTSEGVPVYRCVQNPKEFVLTFPRAYHSGFNCGFSCEEVVNFAPLDWLPFGQLAVELYREQCRKTTISHDKLLFGAAREAVRAHWEIHLLKKETLSNLRWKEVCGKEGVVPKALKSRVEMEAERRKNLCSSYSVKMDDSFDRANGRECVVCLYDLYLSAVGCQCCPEKFACLYHARQLCMCAITERTFLFRYSVNDLNLLVEALEGKLSAIYRWAKQDLGLSLSSFVFKDQSQSPKPDGNPCKSLEDVKHGGGLLDAVTSNSITPRLHQQPKSSDFQVNQPTTPSTVKVCTEFQRSKSIGNKSTDFPSVLKESPLKKSVGEETNADVSLTSGNNEIIVQSDAEDGNPVSRSNDKEVGYYSKFAKLSSRLDAYNNKETLCNYTKELAIGAHHAKMPVISSRDLSVLPEVKKEDYSSHPEFPKINHGKENELSILPSDCKSQFFAQKPSCNLDSSATCSTKDVISRGNPHSVDLLNAGSTSQHPQSYGRPNNETKDEKTGMHSKVSEVAQSITGSSYRAATEHSTRAVSSFDKDHHQRSESPAKVLQRMTFIVQPLQIGVVRSGRLWCSSKAIYPLGFKSRVSYLSVADPGKSCYYISEILDAGLSGPLFMVKVEACPSEIFLHPSVNRCWDMVRDRLNEEILKQRRLGRLKLPIFQPKGSIDGHEMFGFSSPEIIKAIEALDPNKSCTEYWKSRGNTLQHHVSLSQNAKKLDDDLEANPPEKVILRGFFKKANKEELHSLHSILNGERPTVDQGFVTQLIAEEIQDRSQ